ncbi:MAG: class I SAM-dependent methyltransferase [Flavobacteriaceae bacterium]
MISKSKQFELRGRLFRHLDGLVTAPSAYELYSNGVLDYLQDRQNCSLTELADRFKANEGYLNVALRVLCSQGWLSQSIDNKADSISFSLTVNGRAALNYIGLYQDAVELMRLSEHYHHRKFEKEPFNKLEELFFKFKEEYGTTIADDPGEEEVRQQILAHIEGIILGPTVVHLGMSGMFHKYFMETRFTADEFHEDPESFGRLLDIFVFFDWFQKKQDTYQFTEKGLFFARRASAYGVTVSYIPTLRKLDALIFGDASSIRNPDNKEEEKHVDRAMNVWGSGGAHAAYFRVVDDIIVEIFNRPIAEQPKGILDMGCGNGAFLEHLFDVIETQTLRGQFLEEHPLILVGADFNETALKITRANLVKADIWAKVIWGDIGNPELLAKTLKTSYGLDLKELLNVRTFLDHNRIWSPPQKPNPKRVSDSTGAFAYRGTRINNNLVEDSLLEHFRQWSSFVKKYGLLVIELHTVPPELVSQNLGQSPSTAYDATHGYSDQYIVEVPVFIRILKEAGLKADPQFSKKFPNGDLATVTVNLLKS